MRPIRTFPFGSCGIDRAHRLLEPTGFLHHPFADMGFPKPIAALSSGAAVQLHDFCVGERTIIQPLRRLAHLNKREPMLGDPTEVGRDAAKVSEITYVELSTPVETLIDGVIVNFFAIIHQVLVPLRASRVDPTLVARWQGALAWARDDIRERAAALLAAWPEGLDDDGAARFVVENAWSRRLTPEDMRRDLEALRARLPSPMALQLYTFRYMPDGRAVDWPTGFKAEQIRISREMGLPTLDLSPIVERFGAERMLADVAHWRNDALCIQAELMHDFMADILGRPRLDTYPEWSLRRPALFASFPELAGTLPRICFPNLATFAPSLA